MADLFPGDSRTNRERMLAGDDYVADDPESARLSRAAARLADAYAQAWLADDPAMHGILQELFGQVGRDVEIKPPFFADYGEHTRIGDGTFINTGLTALDVAPITIGSDCQIGPNVQLLTATHPIDPARRRARVEGSAPIVIGDNVWLGGGVIVCPGVTIGDNTVVGAGAVVVRDLPANVVAVGNPARVVREITP